MQLECRTSSPIDPLKRRVKVLNPTTNQSHESTMKAKWRTKRDGNGISKPVSARQS